MHAAGPNFCWARTHPQQARLFCKTIHHFMVTSSGGSPTKKNIFQITSHRVIPTVTLLCHRSELIWKYIYIWHIFSDILFWQFIWQSTLALYLASIVTSYLTSFLASILTFSLAFYAAFFCELPGIYSDILSGILSGIPTGIWRLVEVRQCPLRSGARGCRLAV